MPKHIAVVIAMLIMVICQWACAPKSGPTAEEQQNLSSMKRIYEEFINQGKEAVFDELVDANLVEHEEFPGLEPSREGVKQFFRLFREAFPDLHFQVDEMFAAEDKVVARITIHGTHQGEFMDIPPTGKKISVETIDILRFANGKVAEHWGITDNITMMQQLGAIP